MNTWHAIIFIFFITRPYLRLSVIEYFMSWGLMGLVPAVFSVYGRLWANMKCPSFDRCDICYCRMIDSTKLENITN